MKKIHLCATPLNRFLFTWRIHTPVQVHFKDIFPLKNIHLCVNQLIDFYVRFNFNEIFQTKDYHLYASLS